MKERETPESLERRRAERRPLIETQRLDPLEEEDQLEPRSTNRPGRGGSKSDLPILGIGNHCWCGQPMKHDWPGKSEGKPHPKSDG